MEVEGLMKAGASPVSGSIHSFPRGTDPRAELVCRVGSSVTFERSSKLREFLFYVLRCAMEDQPAAATEQQVGIHVFGRVPGYNPGDDNIVRSQARLLRFKLEHHFANEGRGEPVVIIIPKGRYLPDFVVRAAETPARPVAQAEPDAELHLEEHPRTHAEVRAQSDAKQPRRILFRAPFTGRNGPLAALRVASLCLLASILFFISLPPASAKNWLIAFAVSGVAPDRAARLRGSRGGPPELWASTEGLRIIAGRTGAPVVDKSGARWNADNFYEGGVSHSGSPSLLTPNGELFKTIREGATRASRGSQQQSQFRYDIPVPPGTYELRLYFADPARTMESNAAEGSQNLRHFGIKLNGRPLLTGFDAIADAGPAAVDIRVFKDVSPAPDGLVHLEFLPDPEPPFLSALELTPGIPGKMKPIRIAARKAEFVDADGVNWSSDKYYVDGRVLFPSSADMPQGVPELYRGERIGNFSYVIPVPPGSYTVTLHFMESYFGSPSVSGDCGDQAACRLFDVSCNGSVLLEDFDIYQAAGGAYRPIVRTFHGLKPNGQGKLVLGFSPKVNYAEVRAIEVSDEGK